MDIPSHRKILVPTNFSREAAQALALAARLARQRHAELLIVHVHEEFPVELIEQSGTLPLAVLALQEDAIADALAELVKDVLKQGGTARALQVVGSPHAQILRIAAHEKVDLIVMGTRDAASPDSPLGSLAERVARTSWLPVRLVRVPDFDEDTRRVGVAQGLRA